MYDAMHVRRAVGEQGQIISKILEYNPKLQQEVGKSFKRGESGNSPKRLYFSRGHRGVEVFVGGIVGVKKLQDADILKMQ
jgi:acid phosphatase family membrane protein YuiD